MIGTRLFRRHFLISVGVVFAFILLGYSLSNGIMRLANQNAFPHIRHPAVLFARLLEEANPRDRVHALEHLRALGAADLPDELAILDAEGRSLSQPTPALPLWEKIEKPTSPNEFVPIHLHGPQRFGAPPGLSAEGLIRLSGEPSQYLYVKHSMGPPGERPPFFIFLVTVGSLIGSILFGVGFALFLLFRSMREKMGLVDSVINELQHGNLKARFPTGGRLDEMGQAMLRFNKMADEIERLVERLRDTERSRMSLLQELTHDLRTPIASLSNLLATVEKKSGPGDQAIREELLNLARREVEYFGRLVEDLLVLAQVSEPGYRANRKTFPLSSILDEEVESVSAQIHSAGRKVRVEVPQVDTDFPVIGDRHLLKRLLRNALENAVSFARSKVLIALERKSDGAIRVLIEDDGPGLSEATLAAFGERRISRVLDAAAGGRLSVGLGSVIMKTVAEIHRGKVEVSNLTSPTGMITGARIVIELPITNK